MRRRTMRLPLALTLALFGLPAAADAATVGLEGTQLVLRGAPQEQVRVGVLQPQGGKIVFAGRTLQPGPGCATAGGGVECPEAGVTGVAVSTGDANDRVSVYTRVP